MKEENEVEEWENEWNEKNDYERQLRREREGRREEEKWVRPAALQSHLIVPIISTLFINQKERNQHQLELYFADSSDH